MWHTRKQELRFLLFLSLAAHSFLPFLFDE
jgi:hypothetical protein